MSKTEKHLQAKKCLLWLSWWGWEDNREEARDLEESIEKGLGVVFLETFFIIKCSS